VFTFDLTEEERLTQDTARRFAQEQLLPHLRDHERARAVPQALIDDFHVLGLDSVDVPSNAGGQELGTFAKVLVLEELAAVDPGAALALDQLGLATYPVSEGDRHGLLAQLRQAPRGRGVVIEDTEQLFRVEHSKLSGEHPWVPADQVRVAVILQAGCAFIVTEGIQLTALKPCGLQAAGAAQLTLQGVPVIARIEDPVALTRVRAQMRVYVAALLVGAARGAHQYAMRYATERTAFGRPIAHHQALAFLIVDVATAVDAARVALWRAAAAIDAGQAGEWEAASALAEAAEQALFVGPNAVQILGGHGFMKDHPVEKWMRDIRTLAQLAGGRDEAELAAAVLAPQHELRFA
jgi:alkylation response protein AidB-like acyl-CoA dehydrogenase